MQPGAVAPQAPNFETIVRLQQKRKKAQRWRICCWMSALTAAAAFAVAAYKIDQCYKDGALASWDILWNNQLAGKLTADRTPPAEFIGVFNSKIQAIAPEIRLNHTNAASGGTIIGRLDLGSCLTTKMFMHLFPLATHHSHMISTSVRETLHQLQNNNAFATTPRFDLTEQIFLTVTCGALIGATLLAGWLTHKKQAGYSRRIAYAQQHPNAIIDDNDSGVGFTPPPSPTNTDVSSIDAAP